MVETLDLPPELMALPFRHCLLLKLLLILPESRATVLLPELIRPRARIRWAKHLAAPCPHTAAHQEPEHESKKDVPHRRPPPSGPPHCLFYSTTDPVSRAGVTAARAMIREGSHHTSQEPAIILLSSQ